MTIISWMLFGIAGILAIFGIFWDIRVRRIPNLVVVGIAATYLAGTAFGLNTFEPAAFLVAGGVFILAFVLYTLGGFGAGDAKFLTVLALWVGWEYLGWFLAGTALLGGALAVTYLWQSIKQRRAPDGRVLRGANSDTRAEIPYGVPMAIAGIACTAARIESAANIGI